jgi:hypothetical protein
MVRLPRLVLALVLGSAMISRAAAGQRGATSSLTHILTVTVPPRVKVQVASFSPASISAVNGGNTNPSTQGLSLNVSATQAWVLSIGSNPSSDAPSKVRWSLEAGTGFSKLTSSQVRIASGTIGGDSRPANVFFRNVLEAATKNSLDQNGPPVVVTMSAP